LSKPSGDVEFPLAGLPDTAVDVVIPYDRGDLVSRVDADGQVRPTEHMSDGTRIKARVPVALAASLRQFSVTRKCCR
jgi:GTP-binding protein HflX